MGALQSPSSSLAGLAAFALLVGFYPVLAHAGSTDGSNAQASSVGQTLAKLHHENVIEIREGQLARAKGTSKEVRSYGKMLVEDHGKADKKLVALAAQKRVDIATPPREKGTPPARDQQVTRLDDLKGQAFDRAFAEAAVRDHEHAVKMTKQLEEATHDGDVRRLAEQVLPMQQEHLQKARDLQSEVGARGEQSAMSNNP
jgi:putative membrane protein